MNPVDPKEKSPLMKKVALLTATLADDDCISQNLEKRIGELHSYLLGESIPLKTAEDKPQPAGIIESWIAISQEVYSRLIGIEEYLKNLEHVA